MPATDQRFSVTVTPAKMAWRAFLFTTLGGQGVIMCVFTEYLRQQNECGRASEEAASRVVQRLREVVRRHLGRRRWNLPPRYFGNYDSPSWVDAFQSEDVPEIVIDCYLHLFSGRRSDNLRERIRLGCEVEDLVEGTIVPQFLYEQQRRHDPVGYAVYANVRGSVRAMVGDRRLVAGQIPPQDDTPVRFPERHGPVADESEVTRVVQGWGNILLRLARVSRQSQVDLEERFVSFPEYDIVAFTTRIATNAIRDPVRRAHDAWDATPVDDVVVEYDADTGIRHLVRTVGPTDSPADSRAVGLNRLRQLRRAIPESGHYRVVREGMARIVDELIRVLDSDEQVPKQAELARPELARRLDIRPQRVCDYVRYLEALAQSLPDE